MTTTQIKIIEIVQIQTKIQNKTLLTSLGSANIPTIVASIASWFSKREALAAIKITVSTSTPLAKT